MAASPPRRRARPTRISSSSSYFPAPRYSPTASAQQQQVHTMPYLLALPTPSAPSPPSGGGGDNGATGRGIIIGLLSAFGSAALVALVFAFIYFLRYTTRGRILLDALGRPGEYDDEALRAKEEAEAMERMDEMERLEYLRAKCQYSPFLSCGRCGRWDVGLGWLGLIRGV